MTTDHLTDIPGSPEERERIADAPGLLEYFEEIGAGINAHYEANVDFDTRRHNRGSTLRDTFTMSSGATVEFRWLQNPVLTRGSTPGLPDNWLPSGGLRVAEVQGDGTESVSSYQFGRSVAKITHQNDSTYLWRDVYETKPGENPVLIRSKEGLYTNNGGELDTLLEVLKEIEEQLRADPSKTPSTN